jgi:MSHA biogenesis protein MshL
MLKVILIFLQLMVMCAGGVPYANAEEKLSAAKEEKVSLDLKGVDILELFKMLSLKSGITIITSKNVSGRMTIFLNNLSFEDALDVILINQGLASERKGNIVTVMTQAEYAELFGKKFLEKRKFKSLKLQYAKPASVLAIIDQLKSDIGKIMVDEASGTVFLIDIPEKLVLIEDSIKQVDQPLKTEILEFNYSQVKDVKSYLESLATPNLGSVVIDERTNKVVISDLPERVNKIKSVARAFDERSRQVFLDAEIVQITLNDEHQRGIEWEKIFGGDVDLKGKFPVSPSFTPSPTLSADYLQMSVGTLTSDKYTATLSMLQTFGDVKILSRPRITAVNNQEAKILVGSREAYITQTVSQSTSTTETAESIEFVDVGVKLSVVPTINKEGFITMKIKPEISSVRETLKTTGGSQVPIVETSETETVVKVKDGTMIMIGGLIKEEKRDESSGMPGLAKLPFIGGLFKAQSGRTKKTELVIFITPHIISGDGMTEGMFVDTETEKALPPDIIVKVKQTEKDKEIEKAMAMDITAKLKGPKE